MEVGGGSCAVCSDIQRLPEECLARVMSLTSPRDACRSEAVSVAFRSAAVSDDVWKSLLPSDYAEILARAVDRVEFASMKNLYFRLCDPILIDDGKMGFFVDRETGAKCFILPARELGIIWGDTPQYWRWIHHPESRFPEVAELMNVCWLEIRGSINSRMLSKRSIYSAYLIFKLSNNAWGFRYPLQEASVTVGAHASKLPVRLMEEQNSMEEVNSSYRFRPIRHRPRLLRNAIRRANFPQEPPEFSRMPMNNRSAMFQEYSSDEGDDHHRQPNPPVQAQDRSQGDPEMTVRPQTRGDGWMEILLGEFYSEEGDDGEVVMSLLEVKGGNWKGGLTVHGIEIRPKK